MINHKSPKESKICDFLGKLLHKWLSTKGLQNSFCYEKIKMLKKMIDFVHFFSRFPNMKDNQPTTRLKMQNILQSAIPSVEITFSFSSPS